MDTEKRLFRGLERDPSDDDISVVRLIIEYLRNKEETSVNYYNEHCPSLGDTQIIDSRSKKNILKLNRQQFFEITDCIIKRITETDDKGNYYRIKTDNTFFKRIIIPFFPDLQAMLIGVEDPKEGAIMPYAIGEAAVLEDTRIAFKNGAFIYRYARRNQQTLEDNPRLTRGFIHFESDRYEKFLTFHLKYKHSSKKEWNVSGRVYHILSFVFFIGLGIGRRYPFFMILKNDFQSNIIGGLIIRKHDVGYFSSKVMLEFPDEPVDINDVETGPINASQLKGKVDKNELLKLRNVGENNGFGGIFLPKF